MKEHPQLPWSLLLIIIAGVSISTWLIFIRGWSMELAYLVVASGMVILLFLLGLVLLVVTPRKEWKSLWPLIAKTCRQDWQAILNLFRWE